MVKHQRRKTKVRRHPRRLPHGGVTTVHEHLRKRPYPSKSRGGRRRRTVYYPHDIPPHIAALAPTDTRWTQVNVTKNWYRFRVRHPKDFINKSYRTLDISDTTHILRGRLKSTGEWETQSYRVYHGGRA